MLTSHVYSKKDPIWAQEYLNESIAQWCVMVDTLGFEINCFLLILTHCYRTSICLFSLSMPLLRHVSNLRSSSFVVFSSAQPIKSCRYSVALCLCKGRPTCMGRCAIARILSQVAPNSRVYIYIYQTRLLRLNTPEPILAHKTYTFLCGANCSATHQHMASLHFLREDIKEVFNIFDEDASGSISIQEVTKALYTITGERVARSEVLKLIAHARDVVGRQQQKALEIQKPALQSTTLDVDGHRGVLTPTAPSSTEARPSSRSQDLASASATTRIPNVHAHQLDSSEDIDVDVFEQVVLRKLQHRSYEEELAYTFALLEDTTYAGFITKESVRRAAAETGEPLTEAEIAEMFDTLVTGAPTAAVDLSTFTDLQLAARKAEDS